MASRSRKGRHGVKKRQPFLKFLIALGVCALLCGIGVLAALAICATWLQDLPDYENADAYNASGKTRVYASDGTTLLAEFYLENRDPVTLDEISDYVVEGTVATEDERFYEHSGVDLLGIARAIVVNITGGSREGASTITQQFVRNTVLADEAQESTLKRKVREAYISIKLEEMYSKDEILLMYLNTINYGKGAYGIEAASQLYYSKHASELTIAQAATLIGIPQSPTYNNPIDNPENCISRRNTVLDRMLSNGVITQEEHDAAQAEDLNLNVTQSDSQDGIYLYDYFTSYVRDTLLDEYSVNEIFKGGLTIITTLDVTMQDQAEAAADAVLANQKDSVECAIVAVDPDTGFIKALVGGKDYDTDQYNLATQAERQPGSSFKTFTLLAALNEGISPETNLNCTGHVTIDGWSVENYNGADYGTRSIASAYAISSNTGFAELCTTIGPQKVVDMAKQCGIEQDLQAYPSITLGAQEVTPLEMAQAYATIANGGTYHKATPIQQISDSEGNIIYTADTTGEKRLDTALTEAATEVMEGVVSGGTGTAAAMRNGQPIAGKTGTSQNWRDEWFCGITPQLSVAVWMGTRDEQAMTSTGAPAQLAGKFLNAALADAEIEQFPTSDTKLTYTTTDIGHGSGATGESPENEGEEVSNEESATTETTEQKNNNSSGTVTGGDDSGDSGGTSGDDDSGGTSGGDSGGTSGGETPSP